MSIHSEQAPHVKPAVLDKAYARNDVQAYQFNLQQPATTTTTTTLVTGTGTNLDEASSAHRDYTAKRSGTTSLHADATTAQTQYRTGTIPTLIDYRATQNVISYQNKTSNDAANKELFTDWAKLSQKLQAFDKVPAPGQKTAGDTIVTSTAPAADAPALRDILPLSNAYTDETSAGKDSLLAKYLLGITPPHRAADAISAAPNAYTLPSNTLYQNAPVSSARDNSDFQRAYALPATNTTANYVNDNDSPPVGRPAIGIRRTPQRVPARSYQEDDIQGLAANYGDAARQVTPPPSQRAQEVPQIVTVPPQNSDDAQYKNDTNTNGANNGEARMRDIVSIPNNPFEDIVSSDDNQNDEADAGGKPMMRKAESIMYTAQQFQSANAAGAFQKARLAKNIPQDVIEEQQDEQIQSKDQRANQIGNQQQEIRYQNAATPQRQQYIEKNASPSGQKITGSPQARGTPASQLIAQNLPNIAIALQNLSAEELVFTIFKDFNFAIRHLTRDYFVVKFKVLLNLIDDSQLAQLFTFCDQNKDNYVDYVELGEALEGVCKREYQESAQLRQVFDQKIAPFSSDGKYVRKEDFERFVQKHLTSENPQRFTNSLFNQIDVENKRKIGYWDLFFNQKNSLIQNMLLQSR